MELGNFIDRSTVTFTKNTEKERLQSNELNFRRAFRSPWKSSNGRIEKRIRVESKKTSKAEEEVERESEKYR